MHRALSDINRTDASSLRQASKADDDASDDDARWQETDLFGDLPGATDVCVLVTVAPGRLIVSSMVEVRTTVTVAPVRSQTSTSERKHSSKLGPRFSLPGAVTVAVAVVVSLL